MNNAQMLTAMLFFALFTSSILVLDKVREAIEESNRIELLKIEIKQRCKERRMYSEIS